MEFNTIRDELCSPKESLWNTVQWEAVEDFFLHQAALWSAISQYATRSLGHVVVAVSPCGTNGCGEVKVQLPLRKLLVSVGGHELRTPPVLSQRWVPWSLCAYGC